MTLIRKIRKKFAHLQLISELPLEHGVLFKCLECPKIIKIRALRHSGKCRTCCRAIYPKDSVLYERRENGIIVRRFKCPTQGCPNGIGLKTLKARGKCMKCASINRPFEIAFKRLLYGAKIRNLSMSLTYENFFDICKIPNCYYCGFKLNRLEKDQRSYLDRKNNNLGYHLDNVVPCCIKCNFVKGNTLSSDETHLVIACRLRDKDKATLAIEKIFSNASLSEDNFDVDLRDILNQRKNKDNKYFNN